MTINIDENPENADWLKGLREWPLPDTLEGMQAYVNEHAIDVDEFRESVLYKRWVDRLPWLKDLKRREPTQEERDTDTALHEKEMQMDRPGSPEFLEHLRQWCGDRGLDPDVLIQD